MATEYSDVRSVCEWIRKNYDQLRWVNTTFDKFHGQMSWLICEGEESTEVWKKRFSDTFPEFRFECVVGKANVAGTRWESLKEPREVVVFLWKKGVCGNTCWCPYKK